LYRDPDDEDDNLDGGLDTRDREGALDELDRRGALIVVDRCLDGILETLLPLKTDLEEEDEEEPLLEEDRLCDFKILYSNLSHKAKNQCECAKPAIPESGINAKSLGSHLIHTPSTKNWWLDRGDL
tara:strand:- start:628 stop:1005 length:378 start_codon:yes stop_codon:yes gene_type:complete